MRTSLTPLVGGIALTIGLIACFAPGDDVVDQVAQHLPSDTPLLIAFAAPDTLLDTLAEVSDQEALSTAFWRQSGLDPAAPITLARLSGEGSVWALSVGVDDEAVAATGVEDLLDALSVRHHILSHGERIQAMVSFGAVDAEIWREHRVRMSGGAGERMSDSATLEPLGTDAWVAHMAPAALAESLSWPPWARALLSSVAACTLRGVSGEDAWEVTSTCPLDAGSPIADVLQARDDELTLGGTDAPLLMHFAAAPMALDALWRHVALDDDGVDGAHGHVLDLAYEADVSRWFDGLNGHGAVAVTQWPIERRRPGLVAQLGVAEVDQVAALMNAAEKLAGEVPGVRVEPERIGEGRGWTMSWLRHRGRDLSVLLEEDRLWVAFGASDLEDALALGAEAAPETGAGQVSVGVALGEVLELESLIGALNVEFTATPTALHIDAALHHASAPRALRGLLASGVDHLLLHRRQALQAQLSSVCDVIDLHAIDHGLPASLDALELGELGVDPWGRALVYAHPAVRRPHHRYDLCSQGADGVGGSRDDLCYE